MEMPCSACFWDASRGQITALCQIHSSCPVPHRANPMAVCVPFVLCITCDLSIQCLSRCCHPKSLILFKSNGLELFFFRAKGVLYFVVLCQKGHFGSSYFCVRLSEEKWPIWYICNLFCLSVTLAFPLFVSVVAIFLGHPKMLLLRHPVGKVLVATGDSLLNLHTSWLMLM